MAMLSDHARAIKRVCFDSQPSEADLALLGSRERWLVYRDLVRHRLVNIVEVAFARTKNALGDEAFGRVIDEWLSSGGPKTRFFRYVPSELSEFAIPIWSEKGPPWMGDLAMYEITAWDVRHAPPNRTETTEFSFDTVPVLTRASKILRLGYPVHMKPTPTDGYEPEPTFLCIYRNENHRAVPWKLNPMAADLFEAWSRADKPVAQTVQEVAAAHNTEIGPAFVDKLSTLIADALQKGILLGGHPPRT